MDIKNAFLISALLLFSSTTYAEKKIMLFGGPNNDVYLGCFNCNDIASDSIQNDIGMYGSDISPTSIFNDIGKYGSDISQYSPCNDIALNPPILVDEDGGFYGYLTLNDIKPKAITDPKILAWLKYKVCKKR
ncbi:hypothetical protein [Methylomonas koyamae]|uniref:hypothetical protein n=1 Tax=Methylomonas koyamae TaxID=702114 RepID=UPI0006D009AC|nr:hypothetical protein [Methylomonas koyamae]BBL56538.1 hypothetical protein MKFW12EY_01510 [Methylomonas koyamae]